MMNMENQKSGLTKKQQEIVTHFLNLFTDVEGALKKRLGLPADDRTGVAVQINRHETKNPCWRDSANCLRHLADIRNVLTHQRSAAFGYPVAVTEHSVSVLREIKQHLIHPEVVSARYCCQVRTVAGSDSLANVVAMAFENGFSQFPVVDDGKFSGLVTETEITRWLGRRVKANAAEVDLRNALVRTVLKEKDPTTKGLSIFCFGRLTAPVDEVMGLFATEPTLEVVLLTRSGNKDTQIEGIITQWDAARYSG